MPRLLFAPKKTGGSKFSVDSEWPLHAVSPQQDLASDLCVVVCVSRRCVGRRRWVGFDPSAFHVGDELVGDLC